jgi:hypothetical protein
MYKQLNIQTPIVLAHRLGVPLGLIERLRREKSSHYHPKPKVTQPGKEPRPIVQLSKAAKDVLRKINLLLQIGLGHPPYMHGGLIGKTIRSNASPHIGKDFLLKLDIKKFFPSINPAMVISALLRHAGLSKSVAQLVTDVATHEGRLITGSPASLIIASLVIREGTERIHGLVRQRGGMMTVFVDDISISGGRHLAEIEEQCIAWIEETGVKVSEKKRIRTSGPNAEKIITGVDIGHGLDAPKGFRKEIRLVCKRLDDLYKSGHTVTPQERASLAGKLNHLHALNPGMANVYRQRYGHLLKDKTIPPHSTRP